MADAILRAAPTGRVDIVAGTGGLVSLYRLFNTELVNAAADVESLAPGAGNGFRMQDFRFFGLWIKATSPGAVNVVVRILESWDDTAANYAIIESGGSPITLTDTNAHVVQLNPVPMRFLRIRLDGQAGNDAGTRIDAYLWMQS